MSSKPHVDTVSEFMGLRTDTPASKTPLNYSADCSDLVFSVGGFATRQPFRRQLTLPAEIVWRKEFTARNGTIQVLALDVNGALYSVQPNGTYTVLDHVQPGSSCNSVTAYGREYMAFFNANGGSDAPRQWDGVRLSRVSQGGPAAAPMVTHVGYPAVPLVVSGGDTSYAVVSSTPLYGTIPPYVGIYRILDVVFATPPGFGPSEIVILSGSSVAACNGTFSVQSVISPTEFYFSYFQPNGTVGYGGDGVQFPGRGTSLSRASNTVTGSTTAPHNLQVGYQALISGVTASQIGGGVTSLVISNEDNPGVATVTTSAAHGLVPGNVISIYGVTSIAVGGTITAATQDYGIITVTTSAPHNLKIGSLVVVSGNIEPAPGDGQWVVTAIPSPTTFTYQNSTNSYASGSNTGTVNLVFPNLNINGDPQDTQFTVVSCPSSTTFTVEIDYSDGTWTSGIITFAWNGTFYVTAIPSATEFQYQQYGPNAKSSSAGTVTPYGQIAPGTHLVCQHFITETGLITAPSPYFKFTANGGQYALVQNLAIGHANVIARVLSFTGANGSRFFILPISAQVNGLTISTATQINDNVTTSAIIDFADTELFGGVAIDIPGNNLFQQVALNLPRGVEWYGDRVWWIGEANVVYGFLNMGFDGGALFGSTAPLGWTQIGAGVVTQVGFMPALVVTSPDTGEISQSAFATATGVPLLQANLNYSLRVWVLGTSSKVGTLTATISSASTGFTATASLPLNDVTFSGYQTVNFSAPMPSAIPSDMIFDVKIAGLTGSVTYRDMQLIYADNPARNPIARPSYTENPEAYDAETGNIGPLDDSTELRALFVLQESIHFLTQKGLYYSQKISNSEPSSWQVDQIADKCGAFGSNSVATGRGVATWGGPLGAFRYRGGVPEKISSVITPTWRAFTDLNFVYDDADFERVYFGTSNDSATAMIVYDYHEAGKWTPWNRPTLWTGSSSTGTRFVLGESFYSLDTAAGIADDDFGNIGGYCTFGPFNASLFRKLYNYMLLRISGMGVMTPFLYAKTLATLTQTLAGQNLATLQDIVAEWPINMNGRLMFLKLGQPGVQFSVDEAAVVSGTDPNAPMSGVR